MRSDFWYSSLFGITWPSNLGCSTFRKRTLPLTSRLPNRVYSYYHIICCCCWMVSSRDVTMWNCLLCSQMKWVHCIVWSSTASEARGLRATGRSWWTFMTATTRLSASRRVWVQTLYRASSSTPRRHHRSVMMMLDFLCSQICSDVGLLLWICLPLSLSSISLVMCDFHALLDTADHDTLTHSNTQWSVHRKSVIPEWCHMIASYVFSVNWLSSLCHPGRSYVHEMHLTLIVTVLCLICPSLWIY